MGRPSLLAQLSALPPEQQAAVMASLPPSARAALAPTFSRQSLAEFVRQAWPHVRPGERLRWGWHIDTICQHLEAVTRDEIRKLLITICPGSMKSLLVEVFWPAWMWANDPTKQLVCLASDSGLALRDANKHRDLAKSEWYRRCFAEGAGWKFSPSQDAKGYFENTAKGFRYSAGIDGSVTGWRGHGVIMDDLLQARDVFSKPARDAAIYALENIIPSRVNDPAAGFFVMVQQRLCVGDPADWAMAQKDYEHLNLPTEYDPRRSFITYRTVAEPTPEEPERKVRTELARDPRTEEGELLFPALFTPAVVAAAKKNPEMFAAQHQQDPVPPGGGMFKVLHWRFWRPAGATEAPPPRDPRWYQGEARVLPSLPEFDELAVSCDATFGSKSNAASRVSILVGAKLGGDRYLLERVWDRMDFDETEKALLGVFARWPAARIKIIEGKANGPGLISRLVNVHHIAGIIEGETGSDNKEKRANEQLPYQRSGCCYLPDRAPWTADFITEHALFPGPCHLGNDDVDAWSQLLKYFEPGEQTTADVYMAMTE
jgi:predicted phage terminase large subunit-like protein